MPRSRTSRSSSPQKPISAEALQVQKEREELFQNVQEMFSTVDAEVVFNVLSECQWRGEEAIDKLLTIADDAEPPKYKKQNRLHDIAQGVFGSINSEDYQSSIRAHSSTSPLSESEKVIRRPLQRSSNDRDNASPSEFIARGPHEQIQAFSAHFSDPDNAAKQSVDKIEMDLHFPCLPPKASQPSTASTTSSGRLFNKSQQKSDGSSKSGHKQLISQAQSAYSQQYDDAEGAQLWETYKQRISNHYVEAFSQSKSEKPVDVSAASDSSANRKDKSTDGSTIASAVPASKKPGRSFPVRLLSQSPDDEDETSDETSFPFTENQLQDEAFEQLNSHEFRETVLKVIGEVHDDFNDKAGLGIGNQADRPRSASLPFSAASDGIQTSSVSSTPTQSHRTTPVSGSHPMTLPVIGLSANAAEFVPRSKPDVPKCSEKESPPETVVSSTSPEVKLPTTSVAVPMDVKAESIKRDAYITVTTISANVSIPIMSPHAAMSLGSPVSLSPALSPALSPSSPKIGSPINKVGSPMFITPKWPQMFRSMHPPTQSTMMASPGRIIGPVPHLAMAPSPYRLPPGVQPVQLAGRVMYGPPPPVFRVSGMTTMAPSLPHIRQSSLGLQSEADEKVAMVTGQPIMASREASRLLPSEPKLVKLVNQALIDQRVKKIQQLHKSGIKVLVIVRGLPGSGKSILSRALQMDGVVLSTDDYFMHGKLYEFNQDKLTEAHQWNRDRAKDAMRKEVSPVIIDNTNTQRWEFKSYINMGISHTYHIEIMEPDTPWKFDAAELARRNSHGVPKAHIQRMLNRYEHNITVESMIRARTKSAETTERPDTTSKPTAEVSPNSPREVPTPKVKEPREVAPSPGKLEPGGGEESGGFKPQTVTPLSWLGSSGSISSRTSSVDRASSSRGSPIPSQISRSGSPLIINLAEEAKEPVKPLDRMSQPIRRLVPSQGINSQSGTSVSCTGGDKIEQKSRLRSGKKFDDAENKLKSRLSVEKLVFVEEIIEEHVGNKDLGEDELSRIEEELKAFVLLSSLTSDEILVAEELISLKIHGVGTGDGDSKKEICETKNGSLDTACNMTPVDLCIEQSLSDVEKEVTSMDTIKELEIPEEAESCVNIIVEDSSQQCSDRKDIDDNDMKHVFCTDYSNSTLINVPLISELSQTQSNQTDNAQLLLSTAAIDNELSYWGKSKEVPLNATWAADLERQEWEEIEAAKNMERKLPDPQSTADLVMEQRRKRNRNDKSVDSIENDSDTAAPLLDQVKKSHIKDDGNEREELKASDKNDNQNGPEQMTFDDDSKKYNPTDVCDAAVSKASDLEILHSSSNGNNEIASGDSVTKDASVCDTVDELDVVKGNGSLLLLKESYTDTCDKDGLLDNQGESIENAQTLGSKTPLSIKGENSLAQHTINGLKDTDVIDPPVSNVDKDDEPAAQANSSVEGPAVKEKKKKNNRRKLAATFREPFLQPDDKQLFLSKDWSALSCTVPVQPPVQHSVPQQKEQLLDKGTLTNAEDFTTVLKLSRSEFVTSEIKCIVGKASKIVPLRDTCSSHNDLNGIAKTHTNDKSTSTDELEQLSERDGITFLRTCFPDVAEDELQCVLENCDGNVDWTIEMLLSWEYSTPLTVEEKKVFIEGMARVRRGPSPEPVKVVVGMNLQQPLGLLDMCFALIEKQEIATRDEVEQQMIVTSKERLERIEGENITKIRTQRSLSMNDSLKNTSCDAKENSLSFEGDYSLHRALSLPDNDSMAVDINWSVLNEMSDDVDAGDKPAAGTDLSVIFGNSLRKRLDDGSVPITGQGSDTLQCSAEENQRHIQIGLDRVLKQIEINGQRVTSTPVKTVSPDLRRDEAVTFDITDRLEDGSARARLDKSGMEVSEMARAPAFSLMLTEEVIARLEKLYGPVGYNFTGGAGVPVTIDMEMSWALYRGLQQGVVQQEHIGHQLKQDEELARKLQAEEDLARGETSDKRRITIPKVKSLSEIMDEERRAQSHEQAFQKMMASEGGHMAVATVVKRNKLYDKYPQVDRSLLDTIFQSNCFNLSETESSVELMLGDQVPVQDVMTEEAAEEFERQQVEAAKKLSVQVMLDQYLYQPVVSKDYQDGADPVYEDYRGEASLHYRLRHECFQKAQEAFRRGLKQVASFYSQQGHAHTRKIKEANMRASEEILSQRRTDIDKNMLLDLHGFHADEAIAAVDKIIAEKEKSRQKSHLIIITGRGSHSRGGVSKLRPTIMAYLQRLQYQYTETQTGVFKVLLKYRSPD